MSGLAKLPGFAICLALVTLAAGAGMLLAVGRLGSPATGVTAGPFDGMPGLKIRYYDVAGSTAEQIRASAMQVAPIDPETGRRVQGYTRWHLDWDAPGGPDGPCRLDQAVVTLDVTITLPRLTNASEVPPDLLQRWQRFIVGVRAHEAGHARMAYEAREAMLRAIQRADCATARQAAAGAAAELDRRSHEYDRVTQHGRTEGVHFP